MNTITFGGVTSSTYDIYISGEGVWSAPARDAEMVTIPGRNGDFVHDKERFENIEVTYPAFIVKDNNTNFKTKIDGFRNAMCAQVGYQKLTDTFHTDEYRMAALVGGMEIKPILYNDHAATFDITFNCKPQRFLTTGDTAVTVANNGTITNPTLFDAKPQLQVWGYGNINVNGYDIALNNIYLGDVDLWSEVWSGDIVSGSSASVICTFDASLLNAGDTITAKHGYIKHTIQSVSGAGWSTVTTQTSDASVVTQTSSKESSRTVKGDASYKPLTFAKGTSHTYSATTKLIMKNSSDNIVTSITYTHTISYNGSNRVTFTVSWAYDSGSAYVQSFLYDLTSGRGFGYSTLSALGNPSYIDCDLGESYMIQNGAIISLDNVVTLPARLPVLSPGANTITYDNTVTSFKIVPRWWKI